MVLHVLERLSIAALVASSIFQLATGLANAAQWYPWAFGFRETHYAVGWVAVGALLVHVAVKLPIIRDALAQRQPPAQPGGVTRRSLLRATWLAAGVAVLATAAAGVPGVRRISVLAVRSGTGPAGCRSTSPRRRRASAPWPQTRASPSPSSRRAGRSGSAEADLEALPQTSAELPIACVEGWSASGTGLGCGCATSWPWSARRRARPSWCAPCSHAEPGARAGCPPRWPRTRSPCSPSTWEASLSDRPRLPRRVIAPNRPGVLQTKWVSRLEVQA